ncbi:TraR/DksA C4-type zinc finger protein [Cryobacterium sp. SO2]|uniref:TraR/DksA family transcriptional regulator n=1 Tax=Cryobacterium sp. SO2 TaxID=1897060 RepID=UPI00223E32F2|nr:TraR/DksA C4-type zinc finger protein [Cryobacterium sp. SO2]WEO76249.1 TraR/DksA C4-type zinc finger protein [Cryobacterium sp. SO2]
MTGSAEPLTAADVAHFEGLLRRQRQDLEQEVARQGDTLDAVRAARSDGDADDEHDPEGPTLSDEWSLRAGVHSELTASLAAIDAALHRIDDGSYGICLRRGEPIGRERLEARPAAELCIDCAREQ